MKRILYCAAIALCSAFNLTISAQSADTPISIGIQAGIVDYSGEINSNTLWDFDNPDLNTLFGGEFGLYVNPAFDFMLNVQTGSIGDGEELPGFGDTLFGFAGRFTGANFLVKYKFANGKLIAEDARIRPYLAFGGGAMDYKNDPDQPGLITRELVGQTNVGLGFNLGITDRISLDVRNMYAFTGSDAIDLRDEDGNDIVMTLTGGLSYGLGKITDTDGDGVSDKRDNCPNVPGLRELNGCPDSDGDGVSDKDDKCPALSGTLAMMGCPDTDGDGIADNEDACPDRAGSADTKGCPDSDGDGVLDNDDLCPDVAGIASAMGCPDTDGDGIADKDDKCPNVKGMASAMGCPDADGDGVADKDDKCPDSKGTLATNGCGDSDGDGITDDKDKCPTVRGTVAGEGCPVVKEEDQKVFDQALRGIQFQSGKDIIKTSSNTILDNVVSVMKANPAMKLYIQGHTDSQGAEDLNLKLSQDRAAAVKAYLVNKGISSNRMRTNGYGEAKPVGSNATAAGRAQNRRVEFEVEY